MKNYRLDQLTAEVKAALPKRGRSAAVSPRNMPPGQFDALVALLRTRVPEQFGTAR